MGGDRGPGGSGTGRHTGRSTGPRNGHGMRAGSTRHPRGRPTGRGRTSHARHARRRGFGRIAVVLVFLGILGLGLTGIALLVRSALPGEQDRGVVGYGPGENASGGGPSTPTLDFTGFDAGDIISDGLFFDGEAMTRDEVAAFVASWNAGCVAGPDGTPCLAEYSEETPSFPADRFCPGGFEGAEADSAADVVTKAASGCGVSPKVLLVVLQKEQGLITASGSSLTATRYASAMGYACPDTSTCNADYSGFARQVWYAARQFRIYQQDPGQFEFQAGVTSDVLYNPDPDCGSAPVALANQATAGLYNYTPYQPDDDALSGSGGSCSSWGNLNFHAYWKAWFGPTH